MSVSDKLAICCYSHLLLHSAMFGHGMPAHNNLIRDFQQKFVEIGWP